MDVLDVLQKHLNELKEGLQAALCGGTAKDFAEYREICGKLNGLELALRELQEELCYLQA